MRNSKAIEDEGAANPPTDAIVTDGAALAGFEQDVLGALSALQRALAAAVETLPTYPRRAPDLARQLGLERNISWKLFRLMNERDVFVAARFVPGAASIAAFVNGAAVAGVPGALLERVTEAAGRYESVVRHHAGDRASADIMLGGKTGEAGELALRRNAFRSMSFLAGVQAQAQLQTFVLSPGPDGPDTFTGLSLNGFVDLRRMRPDAPVVFGRAMATDDDGKLVQPVREDPVDGPMGPDECVPLLKDFCSSPLPRFRRVAGERGFVENELVEGPVGLTGSATFMAGNVIRSLASRYRGEHHQDMGMVARVRTPTALLVCDVLAHESIFGDTSPRAAVYSDLFGDAMRRGPGRERYRVGGAVKVESLGKGLAAAHTPDIPRYTRMLAHAMARLGWDGSRYNVYRTRVEFPFTPTSVVVTMDLLDPPAT